MNNVKFTTAELAKFSMVCPSILSLYALPQTACVQSVAVCPQAIEFEPVLGLRNEITG